MLDAALHRQRMGTTFYTRPEARQAAVIWAAVASGTLPGDLMAVLERLLARHSG